MPHGCSIVQVWRHAWPLYYLDFQEGSGDLGSVLGVVIVLKQLLCVPVSKGGASCSASVQNLQSSQCLVFNVRAFVVLPMECGVSSSCFNGLKIAQSSCFV